MACAKRVKRMDTSPDEDHNCASCRYCGATVPLLVQPSLPTDPHAKVPHFMHRPNGTGFDVFCSALCAASVAGRYFGSRNSCREDAGAPWDRPAPPPPPPSAPSPMVSCVA